MTQLVIMAGLPATGKSTLSRALAAQVDGVVLDKDSIRAALFPSKWIEYSLEQDDFTVEVMLQTAAHLIKRPAAPAFLFLDGRPFAYRYQIERVMAWSKEAGCAAKILHTICSDEHAKRRIEGDSQHLARNRNFESYLALKARFEEIRYPKLTVDTAQPLDATVQSCLAYLTC